MRIRMFKSGNPFRLWRRPAHQKFAWWPRRLDNGTVVWLEWYTRRPHSDYGKTAT